MAFWGIVVKPGRPFTHTHDSSKGRLHISQATLGLGSSESKSTVQCNVGVKAPVFLCSLFPEKTESLQLHIEFKEAENVTFSVIGSRSVHLTGYYVNSNANDEPEPDGEDIADTETEGSHSDEDTYEDSFIDDSDPTVSDDEVEAKPKKFRKKYQTSDSDNEAEAKPKKAMRRRLTKKYQLSESDDENSFRLDQDQSNDEDKSNVIMVADTEDDDKGEDFFTLSSLLMRKTNLKSTNNASDKVLKSEDADDIIKDIGRKTGYMELENAAKRSTTSHSVAEVEPENVSKPKKVRRESKKKMTSIADVNQLNVVDKHNERIEKQGNNERAGDDLSLLEVGCENSANPKKKSKQVLKEHSTHEADKIEAGDDLSLLASELGSENGAKSKKKRKEPSEEQSTHKADKMSCDNQMQQLAAENQPKKKIRKKRNKVGENIDEQILSTDKKIDKLEIKKEPADDFSEGP